VELVLSVRADRRGDLAAALADLGVAAASPSPRPPGTPPPAS
jgi:hypothetical protein